MAATNSTLLLLYLTLTLTLISSVPYARPAPGPEFWSLSEGPIEFIHACCWATLYPNVCFNSLSGFAATVQLDPIKLAWAATNLTLSQVQSLIGHAKELSKGSLTREEASALHDCAESLDDAADLTQQSAAEIGLLGSAEGEEVGLHVSNAQTWLSAAMTNEDTCTDGMEEVAAGPLKADMSGRVWLAKQFTSIALALVNHLVS